MDTKQLLSALKDRQDPDKISQSFYLSREVVEKLRAALPPGVSLSEAVQEILNEAVKNLDLQTGELKRPK